jgi:antitoxin component YwqK of YwqJK toxin-antitoxin module
MNQRYQSNSWVLYLFLVLPLGCSVLAAETYQAERLPGGGCKIYDQHHVLRATGQAKGSTPVGIWKYYESTGLTLVEIRYQEGIKDGRFQTWYGSLANPNAAGKLQLTGQFRNDQMDGLIKAYDSQGQPLLNRQYVSGKIAHAQTFFGKAPGQDTPTSLALAKRLDQSDQAFFRQIERVVTEALK